jgi:hypothetical protein
LASSHAPVNVTGMPPAEISVSVKAPGLWFVGGGAVTSTLTVAVAVPPMPSVIE